MQANVGISDIVMMISQAETRPYWYKKKNTPPDPLDTFHVQCTTVFPRLAKFNGRSAQQMVTQLPAAAVP